MNRIIKLPKNISDKIAAGEVVTGPISVVKELVENSIDASSDSIVVEIKNGGKTYIRVTDNGTGIDKDDVELAFLPHATSKIKDENDLNGIGTLGFRGEALTSIAAVSKLELITKTEDQKTGTSIYIQGGDIIEKKDIGTNRGTTVVVKDLFYNTPARLKFMKSDRAESTKIIDFITRISIAYPKVKIRMINNDNILFSTNGKGDVLTNILTVFGTESKDDLILAEGKTQDYKLTAYISPSNLTKKTRRNQIYFVNGRVINSKTIENAINKGYQEFVFEGRYPIAYIFLQINPEKLDVNVHPAKTEIRFDEKGVLIDFIYEIIRDKLMTKEAIPDIAADNKRKVREDSIFKKKDNKSDDIKKQNKTYEEYEKKDKESEKVEQVNIKTLLSISKSKTEDSESIATNNKQYLESNDKDNNNNKISDSIVSEDQTENYSTDIKTDKEAGKIVEEQINLSKTSGEKIDIKGLNTLGSIFATYILANDDDSFYIIDQHAAHERINYELFLNQYRNDDKLIQQILQPIIIDVSITSMSTIESWLEVINNIGYDIEVFSDKSLVIKAVPAFLDIAEAERMAKDIIDNIGTKKPENEQAIEKLIQRSCKASVKANDLLKDEEIKALLSDLSKCKNPFACPHGRPVFVKLSKYDVEKLFRRV